MIPYGMCVLTSKSKDGKDVSAATVNWLPQTSFAAPLTQPGLRGVDYPVLVVYQK